MAEIIRLRTYSSKVFEGSAINENEHQFYAGLIHYKDVNGNFQDIELNFANRGAAFEQKKSPYLLEVPEFADQPTVFYNKYERNNHAISSIPGASHVRGQLISPKIVRYRNAFGAGIDFEIWLRRNGFQEIVVFNSIPLQPVTIEYEIQIPTGFNFFARNGSLWSRNGELNYKGNHIFIRNKEQETYFSPAVMWDSDGEGKYVESILFVRNGRVFLKKVFAPRDFAGMVFPVYSDHPTDITSTTDTSIVCSLTGYGTAQAAWDAGHDAAAGTFISQTSSNWIVRNQVSTGFNTNMRRGILSFDTSSIGNTNTVTASSMTLASTQKSNFDNDGNDFMVVVGAYPNDNLVYSLDDFDRIGDAINDPTELSNRLDISSIFPASPVVYDTVFTINATGISYLNKTGITVFGIRGGHDVLDNLVATGSGNSLGWESVNAVTSPDKPPYLSVTTTSISPTVSILGGNILGATIL